MDGSATSSQRKRVVRAIQECIGKVSEPLPFSELYDLLERAIDRYLGPVIGMGVTERWYTLGPVEMEMLLEALEERAAIVHDGPWGPRRVEAEDRCERRTAT
jgi:hypothetical protein